MSGFLSTCLFNFLPHKNTGIYTHTHTHTHTHIHTYIHTYENMVCTYIDVCVCLRMCISVYLHMHVCNVELIKYGLSMLLCRKLLELANPLQEVIYFSAI